MKFKLPILLVLLCLGLDSCRAFTPAVSEPDATVTPEIFMPLPDDQRAYEAARASLAQELNIDPLAIALVDVTPVDWSDACLGLPASGEACAQLVTPGFRVRLQEGDAVYEFHTDRSAQQIRRIR